MTNDTYAELCKKFKPTNTPITNEEITDFSMALAHENYISTMEQIESELG